jgi:O-antigen ligase
MVLLLWFLLMRARTTWARTGIVALLLLDTFVLLATVTRGALVSLAVAATYLAWRTRRRIRFHVFVISLAVILGAGSLILDFVAHHTHSGNVMERMEKTKFEGAIPENRVIVWVEAWDRIMKRPILGYGPYYEPRGGVSEVYWPHNNYLFYWHMLGIIGLLAFLWILWRLWRETGRASPYLGHPSYAASLLLALRAMLVLFIVDQIKIDYLRNPTYAYWVWMFFGLIVVAGRIAKDQEQEAVVAAPVAAGGPRPRRLPAVSPVASV